MLHKKYLIYGITTIIITALVFFIYLFIFNNLTDKIIIFVTKEIYKNINVQEIEELYSLFQMYQKRNDPNLEHEQLYQKYHLMFREYKNNNPYIKYIYLLIVDNEIDLKNISTGFTGIYFVDQNKEGEFGYTPPGYKDYFIKSYSWKKDNEQTYYIKNLFYHFKYGQQKSLLVKVTDILDEDKKDVMTIYLGVDLDLNKMLF